MKRIELLREIAAQRGVETVIAPVAPPGAVASRWPLERLKDEYIREVLRQTGGHRGRAARILGIAPRTLYNHLQRDD